MAGEQMNVIPTKSSIQELNCDSELEMYPTQVSGVRSQNTIGAVGTPVAESETAGDNVGGHYAVIFSIREDNVDDVAEKFYTQVIFSSLAIHTWIPVKYHGVGNMTIHLCLDHVNKIEEVAAIARAAFGRQVVAEYSTRREFTYVAEFSGYKTPMHEGQIVLVGVFDGDECSTVDFDEFKLQSIIMEALSDFAKPNDIVSMKVTGILQNKHIECRVEFMTLTMAEHCISKLPAADPKVVQQWVIYVKGTEELRSQSSPSGESASDSMPGSVRQQVFVSPSGRSRWTFDEHGREITLPPQTVVHGPEVVISRNSSTALVHRPQQMSNPVQQLYHRHQYGYGRGRQLPWGMINSQTLDMRSIQNGGEMRTTVMLRNLPNRWKLEDVKAFIDVHVFGCYDFLYIRMDFANDLNVGYGFVNFVHPGDVVTLVEALDGRFWMEGFYGRKIGLSYATVQGIECLREKFRNSAVMCENPNYRPKLFWAYADVGVAIDKDGSRVTEDRVGTVKDFPFANNTSKQLRSIDNAQHQGLFAPNRARRPGPYNRTSMLDRGIRPGYGGNYNSATSNYSLVASNNGMATSNNGTVTGNNGIGYTPHYFHQGQTQYQYPGYHQYNAQYGSQGTQHTQANGHQAGGQFPDGTPAYFGFNGA